jgi:putative endonuclease
LKKNYYVYILECKDGTLYTGITTDLSRRFCEHLDGKGGHYTKSHPPLRITDSERVKTRSDALKREAEIKKWPRHQKQSLYLK